MHYARLGRTGLEVSRLCLGMMTYGDPAWRDWVLPEADARPFVQRALEAGINFFDTADAYSHGVSEEITGRLLRDLAPRHEVVVATKVFFAWNDKPNQGGLSRKHILYQVDQSLRRLQTDYIDLYQLHRPDFEIPIDETLGALTDLVAAGKVRYIGSSTAPAWKVLEGVLVSEMKHYARFVCEQSPYNLLDRRCENELLPMCQAYDLGFLAWSPMAMGILAGRYADAANPPPNSRAQVRGGIYAERVTSKGIEVGNRFVALAQQAGVSPAQLAVLWVKEQPGVTAPLIGPRTLEQLEEMLPLLEMKLEDPLRLACDGLVAPGGAVANFHNSAPWMKAKLEQ
ncbi:MAG: aldo/keto reductase [Caldilineaceae bacterium]|nr:aldo/keto reductase [Caldilineaceae bacterium]